jgi:hypothetical protein
MSQLNERQEWLKAAYENTLQFLDWRRRSYQLKFPNRATDTILMDLARFCHVNEDCPHSDLYKLGEWNGMQKVFRRIQRHLNLTTEELFAVYGGVRKKGD